MPATAPTDAVRFDAVTKRFGDFVAVNDISFSVAKGTIFGLLGSNGAGKTTSIRMLMNIFKPDTGTVTVLGERASESLKPRLGYLPEERGLYRKMRIAEMLRFFGRIKGRDRKTVDRQANEWLERMGLSGWRNRRAEELSKGMSQKLQFVASVVHGPELLVLDEPFAGLDPVNRDVLRDAVLELQRSGATILFSTHVMEQAERLCDSLVLLHRGTIRLSGTLEQVRASEARQAVHVRHRLLPGKDLQRLPGVAEVSDHGQEAELTLVPGARPTDVLRALLDRTEVSGFEVREPSLHEIFKRIVGGEA